MRGLVGWFRDEGKLHESLTELETVFERLAQTCDAPTSLQPLVPLFESAEFICESVRRGGLDNSAALHKLFAQLERLLDQYSKFDEEQPQQFAEPIPERLFLNLLYYVALSDNTSSKAVVLRRRFRLDRFVQKGVSADRSQAVFEGVGDRLADSIRDAIELETEAARNWLLSTSHYDEQGEQTRKRLAQLEPAIMLLGAPESLRQLKLINANLESISALNTTIGPPTKDRLADALVRLERALDTELHAVRAKSDSAQQTDLDTILASCLTEAQLRLLMVEEDLVALFPNGAAAASENQDASMQATLQKLATIDTALQILPLPEVSPLLEGVQAFLKTHNGKRLASVERRELATVLVSLGYYLNSVLQPNGAAGQLLLEAEEALLELNAVKDSTADVNVVPAIADSTHALTQALDKTTLLAQKPYEYEHEYDATVVDHMPDTAVEGFIDDSLQQLNIINAALSSFSSENDWQKTGVSSQERLELVQAYGHLASEARTFRLHDLLLLANANIELLEQAQQPPAALSLLEESAAVLPQLINQLQSNTDKVFGLRELLDRLNDAGSQDLTQALTPETAQLTSTASATTSDVKSVESHQSVAKDAIEHSDTISLDNINDAVEAFDSTVSDELDSVSQGTLDSTLEQVFFRECDQHLASLRRVITEALSSGGWNSNANSAAMATIDGKRNADIDAAVALPNREMLRALHTLTGSAQTVDALNIIAIAQPLQKAALNKQRSGSVFSRQETEYISVLIDALDARVAAMEQNVVVNDNDEVLLQQLNEFVVRSEPWMPERKAGIAVAHVAVELNEVFELEARELLEQLREAASQLSEPELQDDAMAEVKRALHTIKGSARMASQTTVADRAHLLEDEIRNSKDAELHTLVSQGVRELTTMLLHSQPVSESAEQPLAVTDVGAGIQSGAMGLTESAFENLLALATRASLSQAQLGESLQRLRDACSDIENTANRLQRLPRAQAGLNTAAGEEMVADLGNAARMLNDALIDAETEQAQGARADSALHQSLVRAQLMNFGDAQSRLQQTLNDAALETNKQASLTLQGEHISVDKSLYRKILVPLEHLVRNAVVHGIEASSEREAAGKSAIGSVQILASIDGTDLLIEVSDDGAGINMNKVNSLLAEADRPNIDSIDALREIICESGFSTQSEVDQLAGRGLGLASVTHLVNTANGNLQLTKSDETGTTFVLRLPQKVRINQVVLVEHQRKHYAIPVNFVQAVCDDDSELGLADVQFNGLDYACCALDAALGQTNIETTANAQQAVLLNVHNKHIALLVDSVIGYREVIAQPLGAQLASLQRYIGGGVLANGKALLIPDFNRLFSPHKAMPRVVSAPVKPATTVLVIDDSITMRIAAQTMLNKIGINPSLVRDGAEALDFINDAMPDCFLVDIDMPRMNGFDFLRHLKAQYPDHDRPIIMISTRDSASARNEALALGAMDYLIKPYSDKQLRNALQRAGVAMQ